MNIGGLPERIIRAVWRVVSEIVKYIYHSLKMRRFYEKSRRGE